MNKSNTVLVFQLIQAVTAIMFVLSGFSNPEYFIISSIFWIGWKILDRLD